MNKPSSTPDHGPTLRELCREHPQIPAALLTCLIIVGYDLWRVISPSDTTTSSQRAVPQVIDSSEEQTSSATRILPVSQTIVDSSDQ